MRSATHPNAIPPHTRPAARMLPIAPASAFDREKTATRAGIVSDSRNESKTSKAQAVPANANARQHAGESSWYQGSDLAVSDSAVKAGLCGNGVLLIVPPSRATSLGRAPSDSILLAGDYRDRIEGVNRFRSHDAYQQLCAMVLATIMCAVTADHSGTTALAL